MIDNFQTDSKEVSVFENDIAYIKFNPSLWRGERIKIVLKKKRKSLNEMSEEEMKMLFELIDKCKKFLKDNFDSSGYEIEIGSKGNSKGKQKSLCVYLTPKYEIKA